MGNFRLPDPNEILPTDVAVQVPTADGVDERIVRVGFRQMTSDEFAALAAESDAKVVAGVIDSWDGVHTHAGEVLPCTPENRMLVGRVPCFASAVIRAYTDRISPAKNS